MPLSRKTHERELNTLREECAKHLDNKARTYEAMIADLQDQLRTRDATVQQLMERMMEKYMPVIRPFEDNDRKRGRVLTDPVTGLITEVVFDDDEPLTTE